MTDVTNPDRRVVLVTGPPAAGKNHYVSDHAAPDDVVIDFDHIARELGSPSRHDHPPDIRAAAREVMAARDAEAGKATSGTWWVIRGAPHPAERALLAEGIQATEIVVVATPPDVAKRRAADDGRPAWTPHAIDRWWKRYKPLRDPRERVVTP